STPPLPLFPYTTLFRSVAVELAVHPRHHGRGRGLALDARAEEDLRDRHEERGGNPLAGDVPHHEPEPSLLEAEVVEVSADGAGRSEEHTSELQSPYDLV